MWFPKLIWIGIASITAVMSVYLVIYHKCAYLRKTDIVNMLGKNSQNCRINRDILQLQMQTFWRNWYRAATDTQQVKIVSTKSQEDWTPNLIWIASKLLEFRVYWNYFGSNTTPPIRVRILKQRCLDIYMFSKIA